MKILMEQCCCLTQPSCKPSNRPYSQASEMRSQHGDRLGPEGLGVKGTESL